MNWVSKGGGQGPPGRVWGRILGSSHHRGTLEEQQKEGSHRHKD